MTTTPDHNPHTAATQPTSIANSRQSVALFPGTFDPFTCGHEHIVRRALRQFGRVIIAIGDNTAKSPLLPVKARQQWIEQVFDDEPRVSVITYAGLTANAVTAAGATCILRGIRSVKDFEYEREIADANMSICGVDTLLMYTQPQYSHISSTLVRELLHFGHDITPLLPQHHAPQFSDILQLAQQLRQS